MVTIHKIMIINSGIYMGIIWTIWTLWTKLITWNIRKRYHQVKNYEQFYEHR